LALVALFISLAYSACLNDAISCTGCLLDSTCSYCSSISIDYGLCTSRLAPESTCDEVSTNSNDPVNITSASNCPAYCPSAVGSCSKCQELGCTFCGNGVCTSNTACTGNGVPVPNCPVVCNDLPDTAKSIMDFPPQHIIPANTGATTPFYQECANVSDYINDLSANPNCSDSCVADMALHFTSDCIKRYATYAVATACIKCDNDFTTINSEDYLPCSAFCISFDSDCNSKLTDVGCRIPVVCSSETTCMNLDQYVYKGPVVLNCSSSVTSGTATSGSSTSASTSGSASTGSSTTTGSSTNASETNGSATNGSDTNGTATNGLTSGSATSGAGTSGGATSGGATSGSTTGATKTTSGSTMIVAFFISVVLVLSI